MTARDPGLWLQTFFASKARVTVDQFDTIADAPVYELIDSLELVELFDALEREFETRLDARTLDLGSTVRQLTERLSRQLQT